MKIYNSEDKHKTCYQCKNFHLLNMFRRCLNWKCNKGYIERYRSINCNICCDDFEPKKKEFED